ncbi:MAG: phosphorylase, partial [Bacteroidetes bacterium]
HLNLKPEDIATTIIFVGDQGRVAEVAKYFDSIELEVHHREFQTTTGTYRGTRLTVTSTGIGPDNIDIVVNEMDALVNIDLKTRTPKKEHTQLTFVRIGTSGTIQKDIPVDSFIVSERAIGFDNVLHYYGGTNFLDVAFSEAFMKHTKWNPKKGTPYVVSADKEVLDMIASPAFIKGITVTNIGFYGPQGRKLRLSLEDDQLNGKMESFRYNNDRITNLEMETSAIYGLSKLLGHRAVSLNAVIANRVNGTFSANPKETINRLIIKTLDLLTQ